MNTKTFAQLSRINLMNGVGNKLRYWGFTENGTITEEPLKIEGGYMFRGEIFDDNSIPGLWQALKTAVEIKGFDEVVEEAAYTWFNRMMALQILSKNGYEQPQLVYAEGMEHTPMILHRARQGFYGFLSTEEKRRLSPLITDYSQDQSAFTILLIGYCHSHILITNVFGSMDDYTELLLPDNMLTNNGFLHLLNTTDAISDAQYKEVELIGWLYQFYISDKKDEVFAGFKKNKKAEAKDIPAATQIFTPNWIVKYMVQNTVGKLWLDLHPDSPLRQEMKYLVEASFPESEASTEAPLIKEASELKLLDPASGSGHILVEGLDLLFKMYKEEFYTDEEAVESILKNNLFGLDIDKRATQLAQFAVLLKAAKVYPAVLKKGWMPQIYAMPAARIFTQQEILDFLGNDGSAFEKHLTSVLTLMQQAQNLGSIMRFDLPDDVRSFIVNRLEELLQKQTLTSHEQAVLTRILPFIKVYGILSSQYEAIAANPPYMGQKNMNGDLKRYLDKHYPDSCFDLMTVFMEMGWQFLKVNGKISLINLPSWMFISSFEKLRNTIIQNLHIDSIILLGRGIFGSDFGSVMFSISKRISDNFSYFKRLSDNKVTVDSQEIKKARFHDNSIISYSFHQSRFLKLPSVAFSFWIPEKALAAYDAYPKVIELSTPVQGLATGENERFLRNWYEVSKKKIGHNIESIEDAHNGAFKYFPYNKGGEFKKWYGNKIFVIAFDKENAAILSTQGNKLPSRNLYFKTSITWSKVTLGGLAFRYFDGGALFDVSGCSIFGPENVLKILMGLLNSTVKEFFVYALSQSVNYEVGLIKSVPVANMSDNDKALISNYVEVAINISRSDWDSREISWDFQSNPLLVDYQTNLAESYERWLHRVSQNFFQLHNNEEELNRIFINLYDLQNELKPEIPLKDTTILLDELDNNGMEQIQTPYDGKFVTIKKSVVIQQLISYAMGVFMGRYRLDKTGLNIAHPNPTKEELAYYSYKSHTVEIDQDAIIPLMGSNCDFPDDAVTLFKNFLDIVWGEDTRIANINFIQECVNQDLEKFMVKEFWKAHCSMYKKKPIYWLFSSANGAFQVLVYMHRMNSFTVEKIRSKYLMDHLRGLRSKIALLEKSENSMNAQDFKSLDKLRKDFQECEQYDMALKTVADEQIPFDLDNGVTENYKLFKGVVAEIK